jgi:NadR type nicotinamide-nucleotide adenylyltransferase
MKRIAITGPECCGKTTLARQLAAHFGTLWVPEYAREYLEQRDGLYGFEDIAQIAKGQMRDEERLAALAKRYLFCDTCLLVCKVWSLVSFGRVDDWITDSIELRPYDLYILPQPDFDWVGDPLRENPEDRWELLERYREELKLLDRSWLEVAGQPIDRLNTAIAGIRSLESRVD